MAPAVPHMPPSSLIAVTAFSSAVITAIGAVLLAAIDPQLRSNYYALAPGAGLDRTAMVAHCRERISPQKTPAHWIAIDDWPLTGSGKIQKFVLRDRFVAGEVEAA